jgi:hypothetical protein
MEDTLSFLFDIGVARPRAPVDGEVPQEKRGSIWVVEAVREDDADGGGSTVQKVELVDTRVSQQDAQHETRTRSRCGVAIQGNARWMTRKVMMMECTVLVEDL